ncbi:hypothetical protein GALL_506900 [mine drainage metagenome]|uniref:Uncharacterized protein n=1 Tax=mine drainage metagenome TaxID=410659 RepID=A0A1J5P955_9ZZZZ
MQPALQVDENGFAGSDVTHEPVAVAFQRDRFARHHDFAIVRRGAEAQRADAIGIAESEQSVTGDQRDHCIRAEQAAMHGGDRGKDIRR